MSDNSRPDDEQPGWASPGGGAGEPPTDPWGNPMPAEPPTQPPGQPPAQPPTGEGNWWGDASPGGAMPPPMGQAPAAGQFGPPKTEPKAIWGLVLSIVGLIFCGVVLQPVAILLGFLARKSIRESYGTLKGDGIAIAAIVIGIIGFILSIIVLIMVLSDPDFMNNLE